jgi:hypothetical protein
VNLAELDAAVEQFKRKGNKAFEPIERHYRGVCRNQYKHLSKYIRDLDRDDFRSRFRVLLFRSLLKFDPAKEVESPTASKFDAYFSSALRKMSMGVKRSYMARKRQIDRRTVSLAEARVELPDASAEQARSMTEVADVIECVRDSVDRQMLAMWVDGGSRKDVCESLRMPLHTYRSRLARLRGDSAVVSLV